MRLAHVVPTLLLPALAWGQEPGRETIEIVESKTIPREIADDVARTFNASSTLRLTGAHTVGAAGAVTGDVAILEGILTIAGHVTGRIVALNATVIADSTARVDGDVIVLGGRLTQREGAVVGGDVRTYGDRLMLEHDSGRIIVHDQSDQPAWYRGPDRWRSRGWSDLRFVSARTYNRVEGLPIILGPMFGREFAWGRVTADVLGIIRSADSFEWKPENVGHNVKLEVSVGKRGGIRLGGRVYDVVESVEPWQIADAEVGLASFFVHRDYRDYYDRHGGGVYGSLFFGEADLTLGYSDQHWGSREARSPFTLFNGGDSWRPNPILDNGEFHLFNATLRYDTRNDDDDPWSGWYVVTDFEHGSGEISVAGETSPLAREGGVGRTNYNRLFFDLRRYNRFSPDGQLNLRLVLGGWLGGDELPLQRRLSVGGPGSLPGYEFREQLGSTDYWTCAVPASAAPNPPPPTIPSGSPAQCERIALAQIEYRGEIRVDPLGIFKEERVRRRRGWGRGAEWVVFADAGRGWLVGPRVGSLQYPSSSLPALGTFRTDVGVGLRLDEIGLYVVKPLPDRHLPLNFLIRLRPRI